MRLCSGPGCRRSVPEDVRFCDECKPTPRVSDEIREHTSGYDAQLDTLRKGSRWQRVRAEVVRRDPMCKRCDRAITEIVDHIVPAQVAVQQARDSGVFPFDRFAGYYLKSNLQGLCRCCHYIKTMEDKTHVGPWPDVVERERLAPKKRWTF